jgi:hypothetical protein
MSPGSSLLLAGALVAAGCAHGSSPAPAPQARVLTANEAARAELRSAIHDKERAAQADELLVRLQELLDQASAQAEIIRARIDGLDRRHDTSADQLRAALAAADAGRLDHQLRALPLRDQLARLLTPEEWSSAARLHLLAEAASPQLGDPARLEPAIEHHLHDEGRLARLQALVAAARRADQEARAAHDAAVEQFDRMVARQGATWAELYAAADAVEGFQRARRDRHLALRLELATLTTPGEFAALGAELLPGKQPTTR